MEKRRDDLLSIAVEKRSGEKIRYEIEQAKALYGLDRQGAALQRRSGEVICSVLQRNGGDANR